MRKLWLLVGEGLLALMLCVPHTRLTQPASDELHKLQQDMEAIKAGQKQMLNDLQEIKKLLSSRGDERSPIRDINTTLHVVEAFSQGDPKATLTLVEFTDYP
jgi:type II secretory pathway component PulM